MSLWLTRQKLFQSMTADTSRTQIHQILIKNH